MKKLILLAGITLSFASWAQRGKDGAYTVPGAGTIVNAYTSLTANAGIGATSITVANNSLNSGAFFTSNLAAGDLVFIVQLKGVDLDGNAFDLGGDSLGIPDCWFCPWTTFGEVDNYLDCGNHEYAEVTGVTGGTVINLRCGLEFSYTASGAVQVIRVPRMTDLTIPAATSITAPAWDGTSGGAVILEVEGDLTLNGTISVDSLGFRGGLTENFSLGFGGQYAHTNAAEGGKKGEGVGGYELEYLQYGGRYCRGAFGNAGGGGTAHNAGGGGGANTATIAWNEGLGNPDLSGGAPWVTAWNLETGQNGSTLTSATTSGGGGRGGYSHASNDANATTTPPDDAGWGGDNRRVQGGLGGRPLDYSTGKIFFGGGGGAGDSNNGDGGKGGSGAGLVYVRTYGTVSGAGSIEANGGDGESSYGPPPGFNAISGEDAAGGAGAGGTVLINSVGNISGITINANGGAGGDQNLQVGAFGNPESEGPGGGGGGGYVSQSASTATVNILGGANGTTNSPDLTEFPPNGATMGSSGDANTNIAPFGITISDTVACGGGSITLTVGTYGTIPGGTVVNWYSDLGITLEGTGNSFVTPGLGSTTTYYVGLCPGHALIPVTISVSPIINIDASNINITDENCGMVDGSITGITASGGTGTLSYDWSGNATAGPDTLNIGAGSYTLTVTDANGCTATSGPHVVNNIPGPVLNVAGLTINDENCGMADGSITGITVSGGTTPYTYDWSGNNASGTDTLNIGAGSFTLTVTDAAGCTASSGPHVVNNNPGPSIDVTGLTLTDENCGQANGSITGISVSGGTTPYTYDWNGNAASGPDTTGVGAGSYTLTVTDANGCVVTSGPHTINNIPAPTIDISGIAIVDENCGAADGSITGITVSGGTTPYTYDWNGNSATGPDTVNLGPGSYTLTVTDAAGCTTTSGPHVVNSAGGPVIASVDIVDPLCNGTTDGTIDINLSSGTAPLQFSADNGANFQADSLFTGQGAGTYDIIVQDGSGCQTVATVTLTDPPVLDVTASTGADTICDGGATMLGAAGTGGTGSLTYAWTCDQPSCDLTDPTSSSPIASPGVTTMYFVTATDSNGCTAMDSVNVVVIPSPTANAGVDVIIAPGDSTQLVATPTGADSYLWSPASSLSDPAIENPWASPTVTTTYGVTITIGGCSSTDSVTVFVDEDGVLFVPNVFSPNGDGMNDILFVYSSGVQEFEFHVYDRWGAEMFFTDDASVGWDGTYQGSPVVQGVYVYTVGGTYTNGDPLGETGNITVVR